MNAETKKVFSDSCIKSNYVLDKKGLGESLLKKAKKKKKTKKGLWKQTLFSLETQSKKKKTFLKTNVGNLIPLQYREILRQPALQVFYF